MLTLPNHGTLLSATTSDPDGDVISHWWRVKSKPHGADPAFAKQGGRETGVSGLTVEGRYRFELTAVDRTKCAKGDVIVTVVGQESTATLNGQLADPLGLREKSND